MRAARLDQRPAHYRAHPERVAGLVLAATVPPTSSEGASFLDEAKAMHARMDALKARLDIAAAVKAAGVDGDASRQTPQARRIALRIREFAAGNLWHVERWREIQGGGVYYSAAVDDAIGATIPAVYDTLDALAAHPAPVTVLQGDHDYLDPGAARWTAVAPRAPTVEIHVLPGAGHYSWIDNPEAFHRAFDRALLRATSAAGTPATAVAPMRHQD
jgi:pimeloyl-ACP methyl ester carboxylesterase